MARRDTGRLPGGPLADLKSIFFVDKQMSLKLRKIASLSFTIFLEPDDLSVLNEISGVDNAFSFAYWPKIKNTVGPGGPA